MDAGIENDLSHYQLVCGTQTAQGGNHTGSSRVSSKPPVPLPKWRLVAMAFLEAGACLGTQWPLAEPSQVRSEENAQGKLTQQRPEYTMLAYIAQSPIGLLPGWESWPKLGLYPRSHCFILDPGSPQAGRSGQGGPS